MVLAAAVGQPGPVGSLVLLQQACCPPFKAVVLAAGLDQHKTPHLVRPGLPPTLCLLLCATKITSSKKSQSRHGARHWVSTNLHTGVCNHTNN